MAKVPFRRRISDFFTQGHWDVFLFTDPWTLRIGVDLLIDSAPGFHFDRVGGTVSIGLWTLGVYWVDDN